MRLKEEIEAFGEGGKHRPEVVLRSCQTCFLWNLKKSLFPMGEECQVQAGAASLRYPWEGHSLQQLVLARGGCPGSPPGPFGTSPTANLHPFSPAAEAADSQSWHVSQAPSQPATHTHFSVCSGSPTFTFSLKRRKNKLMKQCSMQDAPPPLAAWLLLWRLPVLHLLFDVYSAEDREAR